MDLLHDIASEGIHSKSDEECLDIFNRSRLVFECLMINLKVSAAEAKTLVEKLRRRTQYISSRAAITR